MDLGLYNIYYIITYFYFVLSLGCITIIFSRIIFNKEKNINTKNLLFLSL